MKIKALLDWSDAFSIKTSTGLCDLRIAEATPEFWELWSKKKIRLKLKEKGIHTIELAGVLQVGWWKQVKFKKIKRRRDIPCPDGLKYRSFQKEGIKFALAHKRCLIADDMGLGKTVQAIGALNVLKLSRVLIVCPATLKLNWQREVLKWTTCNHNVNIFNKDSIIQEGITIINYDILHKNFEQLQKHKWEMLIGDESQYVKNAGAKRTQAFYSLKSKRTLCLTGTPVENRPIELFCMLHSFKVPCAISRNKYINRYCDPKESYWGLDVSGKSNTKELGRKLRASCMIRRIKADVLKELPPKIKQIITLPANSAGALVQSGTDAFDAYKMKTIRIRERLKRLRDGGKQNTEEYRQSVIEMRAKFADFAELAHIRHETALKKVPFASELIVEAVQSSGSVIVFGHHRDVLTGIADKLEKKKVSNSILMGGVSSIKKQRMVDAFQNKEIPVFLSSIRAGGIGLNLNVSNHVMFIEFDWSPAKMEQAADRPHRIGQTKSVLVQYLVFDNSIDGMFAKTLVGKEETIDSIMIE